MHYIRFLKPPRLTPQPRGLTSKLTLTTDLGESFLPTDVVLVVDLTIASTGFVLATKEFLWKGSAGMRALEVVVPIPARGVVGNVRMVVRPRDGKFAVPRLEALLDEGNGEGRVMAVRSMAVDVSGKRNLPTGMAERVFRTGDVERGEAEEVHIWEETGESIARHIWDAGLVFSSFIARLYTTTSPSLLPSLETRLRSPYLSVLELGAGCGIVSLTLSTHHPTLTTVLLTDLPEASSILARNLSVITPPQPSISHQVLDWSLPLPQNVRNTKWDLVLVADCTYNPDVVPDLVKTLGAVVEGNAGLLVGLAMKVRHESEMAFFGLMIKRGFVIVERCKVALPVSGGEAEEIEIIVFQCSDKMIVA